MSVKKPKKPETFEKPKDINEYKQWLHKEYNVKIDTTVENHYDTVALRVKESFSNSSLWLKIESDLKNFDEEYYLDKQDRLLAFPGEKHIFSCKPFNSFLLKTFRRNVLENERWPEEPTKGWNEPSNWISKANDIVRICITVKYLDGVGFLLHKLEDLAKKEGADVWKYYVGGVDGYYAGHFYIKQQYEVFTKKFDTEFIDVIVEVQITTQIHEVIRRLLYKHFAKRRKRIDSKPEDWQWDYQSEEFVTNYLGHQLHYIDGMIMTLRDRNEEEDANGQEI